MAFTHTTSVLVARRIAVGAALALVVALVAATVPAQAHETTQVVNLQRAGTVSQARGAFTVDEAGQGADLNGDGDMMDHVLHLHIAGGPLVNTQLATPEGDGSPARPHDPGIFFGVLEAAQGNSDLNGDGDTVDNVLHLYQPGRPIRNLGLVGFSQGHSGLLVVNETTVDLNGDGDTADDVYHVYDFTTGTITNLGVAGSNSTPSGPGALLTVEESQQGADLNGDGDMTDDVMFRFDPTSGLTNLGLAGEDLAAPSSFAVDESKQGAGGTDFNGDGDTADQVLHIYDVSTNAVRNTGFPVVFGAFPIGAASVLFAVPEAGHGAGGTDLNGDGDKVDAVVHLFTPPAVVLNTGFTRRDSVNNGIWRADEVDQGTDLNGDGDTADNVLHHYALATGAITNLQLGGFAENVANLFHVQETLQNSTDLNGDGDAVDTVLHWFGPVTNLGLAKPSPAFSRQSGAGPGFLFQVDEAAQGGTDLNGDGDATDKVVHAFVRDVAHDVGLTDPATGVWRLRDHDDGTVTDFFYGNPLDVPFMGDWDCDGVATPGLFRQSDAFAYLRNSNTQGIADIRFFFGNPSDVPLAGDFNGDGCDTLSIYRPEEQRFYIINRLGENEGGLGAADFSFGFGNPDDKPVVGDWDDDGIDEVGLHRESTGFFYFRNTLDTGTADGEFFFGDPGDRFVAGDWGIVDGVETPAVFRPSSTTFFFRHTNTPGFADSQFIFGEAPWLPVSGPFGL